MVHEYAHFELFMNFPAICLDFVVFARIAQINGSKAYLEAQLLIGLVIFKAPSVTELIYVPMCNCIFTRAEYCESKIKGD